ncbi:guanine nucleotide exchange factor [Anaeramoeba flamelloides]|uniref:Guanine nucleotide exchange factor n=1 Tax=Anaeramoeba flamelloides TaxID=1746091 RepID=A0AAV7Y3Z4_9EUKA|nr:guanine nucleotide exchange factor [Anaeramoeba flamelloides]
MIIFIYLYYKKLEKDALKKKENLKISKLTDEITKLKNSQSIEIITKLKQEIVRMKMSNADLRGEISELSRESTASSGQTRDLQTENDILRESLEEISKNKEKISKRNVKIENKYMDLQSTLLVLKDKLEYKKEISNELKLIEQTQKHFYKKNIKLNLEKRQFVKEKKELQHQIQLSGNKYQKLQKKIYQLFDYIILDDESFNKLIKFKKKVFKKSNKLIKNQKNIFVKSSDITTLNFERIKNISSAVSGLINENWMLLSNNELNELQLTQPKQILQMLGRKKSALIDIEEEIVKKKKKNKKNKQKKKTNSFDNTFLKRDSFKEKRKSKEIGKEKEKEKEKERGEKNDKERENEKEKEKDNGNGNGKGVETGNEKETENEIMVKKNNNKKKKKKKPENKKMKTSLLYKEITWKEFQKKILLLQNQNTKYQKLRNEFLKFKIDFEFEKQKNIEMKKKLQKNNTSYHLKIEKLQNRIKLLQQLNPAEFKWEITTNLTQQLMKELKKANDESKSIDKTMLELNDQTSLIIVEIDNEIIIKAGTINKLLDLIIQPKNTLPTYPLTFLISFRNFTTSEVILNFLIQTYQITLNPKKNKKKKLLNNQEPEYLQLIQSKILTFLFFWIKHFFSDFEENTKLSEILIKSLQMFQQSNFESSQELALQIKTKFNSLLRGITPFEDILQNSVITKNTPKPILPKKILNIKNITLLDISEIELARQITLYEMQLFQKIKLNEFFNKSWSKRDTQLTPNLIKMIERFNNTALWIVTNILEYEKIKTRSLVIKKILKIAQHCVQLGNFNAVTELTAGLHNASIRRLKKSWNRLLSTDIENFENLSALVSVRYNFKKLRTAINERGENSPVLPYIGMYLTDLTFIEDGNPNFTENKLINFQKHLLLSKLIRKIRRFQEIPFELKPIQKILNYLSDFNFDTEEVSYEKSLQLEPKVKEL